MQRVDITQVSDPRRPTHHDERRVLEAFRQAYAKASDGDKLEIQFGRSGRFFVKGYIERS